MRIKRVWPRIRRILHVRKGEPYHRENSIRGVRRAKRRGYDAIDIDLQMTRDGVIVATHWGQPLLRDGFRDPQGKITKRARVRNLTWAEVQRLEAPGGYRIQRLETILRECARKGIIAVLEPKADTRFEKPAVWQHVAAMADDLGAHIAGYTIRTLPMAGAGARRAAAMRAAGIDAHVIH